MHNEEVSNEIVTSPTTFLSAEQKQEINRLNEESRQRAAEAEQRAEDAENALPWIQQESWRRRGMYRGWMLEPTIEQHAERAAITRSHFGYQCLNTPDLGFVDVDFNLEYFTDFQQFEALSKLRDWVSDHERQSFRAYRTSAGLRFMRTDAPQPIDDTFDELCKTVGTDDIYRQLCHEQKAFRARLTPKPSRCGIEMPHWSPYEGWTYSDPDGTIFQRCVKAYEILAERFKVCELVETAGSGIIHSELLSLVELHDTRCKVFSDLEFEPLVCDEEGGQGPSSMQVIAFNEIYRPEGMADNIIWNILPWGTRQMLRSLEHRFRASWVLAEDRRLRQIAAKWNKPADLRDAA